MESIKELIFGKPIDPNNPPPEPVYPGKFRENWHLEIADRSESAWCCRRPLQLSQRLTSSDLILNCGLRLSLCQRTKRCHMRCTISCSIRASTPACSPSTTRFCCKVSKSASRHARRTSSRTRTCSKQCTSSVASRRRRQMIQCHCPAWAASESRARPAAKISPQASAKSEEE